MILNECLADDTYLLKGPPNNAVHTSSKPFLANVHSNVASGPPAAVTGPVS